MFGGLNLAALALFVVCFTLFPILSLKPRKFAILYVYASLFLTLPIPSIFRFLDLARTPPLGMPLAPLSEPSLASLVIYGKLPCRRSKKMVCILSYPQHHRRARSTWPSSPRDDPAPDAKGSGMARLTTSSRLVPGRPAAAVHRDLCAMNQISPPLASLQVLHMRSYRPCSIVPFCRSHVHDLAQYPALYRRSSMHDFLPSACGANVLVRWSMASALFLGSWAALMGPMIYGKSAPNHHLRVVRLAASITIVPTLPSDPCRRSCGCRRPCTPRAQNSTSIVLTADPTAKHLLSQERLPFTATYFGSIGLTLYFAVGVRCLPPSYHSSLPHTITLRQSRHCRRVLHHQSCNISSLMLRHHEFGTPKTLSRTLHSPSESILETPTPAVS